MDKLVVGYVGGDTNLDKVIQNFSGAVKYNITHAFTMILNSTAESKGVEFLDGVSMKQDENIWYGFKE